MRILLFWVNFSCFCCFIFLSFIVGLYNADTFFCESNLQIRNFCESNLFIELLNQVWNAFILDTFESEFILEWSLIFLFITQGRFFFNSQQNNTLPLGCRHQSQFLHQSRHAWAGLRRSWCSVWWRRRRAEERRRRAEGARRGLKTIKKTVSKHMLLSPNI